MTSRGWAGSCLVGSWLLACSGGPPRPDPGVDCSVEDAYELEVVDPMEGTNFWYGFPDTTPGALAIATLQPLPEGRCGSTQAMLLSARGLQDWGGGFGEYQTTLNVTNGLGYVDATGYEGISFWARATGFGTSSGFLFSINDSHTADPTVCNAPMAQDVAGGAYTYNEAGMIVPVGGQLPSANDCGNSYQIPLFAHREWHLHTLPFEAFKQEANPNRRPTGVDRATVFGFRINVAKDSNIELWLDDLGLYRRRVPEATSAVQAAQ